MKKDKLVLIMLLFLGCTSNRTKSDEQVKSVLKNETHIEQGSNENKNENEKIKQFEISFPLDSIIDTTTLKGKRDYLLYTFAPKTAVTQPQYYSLVDLNYDNCEDFIIGYYGASGTGFKHRIKVFLYNERLDSYVFNEELSDLPNPSFFLKQKKITSFYIAAGGGSGVQLEWINDKWNVTKEFSVDNKGDLSIWKIKYPLTNETLEIMKPYEMSPPKEILELNIDL